MAQSPYAGVAKTDWPLVTEQLISSHPLTPHIVEIINDAWQGMFSTSIGQAGLKIGVDIFPKPQIIGALLHELIPAGVAAAFPGQWRKEIEKSDKDIVCVLDDFYSIELKTSSNKTQIFGNRSYAQQVSAGGKSKDGFYLAVNFEAFVSGGATPKLLKVRFGWLDHTDWIAQVASTGQQARLAPETYRDKFITLFG
ncbi:restriction endonuclease [Lysobacteraceae bacterium NML95-0200]|nr:restriction endonuclease [Xanthomonadaceae bacterium NML95-0200]